MKTLLTMNFIKMKKPIWKYLTTAAFIALYSFIIPYGFITIDPCACTPGHDDTIGYILMALFPLLLGLLLYFLFAHNKTFHFKTFLKVMALSVAWLVGALILWIFAIRSLWYIVKQIELGRRTIIPHIFEYGCYNDIQLTDLALYLTWLMSSVITGLVICLIVKWKCNKNSNNYDRNF